MFANFEGESRLAAGGIALVLPSYNAYAYSRRAIQSFCKYTPEALNPVVIHCDDASPSYEQQSWDFFYGGLQRDRIWHQHFEKNGGLTRSWNWGLRKARELGCKYAIAGNSDILFTEGFYEGLLWHLDRGTRLVGPVTNAPGWSDKNSQRQNVRNYYPNYDINDDPAYLQQVARYLKETQPISNLVERQINGFCTMSTLDYWWAGAFDAKHVFDPKYKLTGNEDELERRWTRKGWRVGFVPSSFVFHYRAVSRGDKSKHTGWTRLADMYKPV